MLARPILGANGMRIGATTALLGAMMDQQNNDKTGECQKCAENWTMVIFNLLFIGPCIFSMVSPLTVSSKGRFKTIFDTFGLVTLHSMMYSFMHRVMHKIVAVRPIHKKHHTYIDDVRPSNANAVSSSEFLLAYMLPFVTGCYVLRPSLCSLSCASMVVSIFNLLVHSKFVEFNLPWFFVTSEEHLQHHKSKSAMYSAPTFSWEKILRFS